MIYIVWACLYIYIERSTIGIYHWKLSLGYMYIYIYTMINGRYYGDMYSSSAHTLEIEFQKRLISNLSVLNSIIAPIPFFLRLLCNVTPIIYISCAVGRISWAPGFSSTPVPWHRVRSHRLDPRGWFRLSFHIFIGLFFIEQPFQIKDLVTCAGATAC